MGLCCPYPWLLYVRPRSINHQFDSFGLSRLSRDEAHAIFGDSRERSLVTSNETDVFVF